MYLSYPSVEGERKLFELTVNDEGHCYTISKMAPSEEMALRDFRNHFSSFRLSLIEVSMREVVNPGEEGYIPLIASEFHRRAYVLFDSYVEALNRAQQINQMPLLNRDNIFKVNQTRVIWVKRNEN